MPKILIVDDEPSMRDLLKESLMELEEKGVELFTANDGEMALECIKSEEPELVLLDAMMLKLSGFEVCNIVKNKLGMKGVYVLMLTARGQKTDKQKGMDMGADCYMTKPFDPDDILKKAAEVLGIEIGL